MDADPYTAATPLDHATIRSIVVGIMLAMFLAALDQTIVATAMPTIGRELRDLEHLPWIASAYLLSATAVTPLYGKLSDIHGRRRVLLLGIGIFIVGSVACALASSMLVLILARGLQGLGGGGLSRSPRRSSRTWSRPGSGRATRAGSPRCSSPPASPVRCWAASSPSTCTGR